jgi:aspartyl aminopeptidase
VAKKRPSPAAAAVPVERDLLDYIDASPTPWHAVANAAARLEAHGFSPLDEREAWRLEPGGRHYVIRGGSSIAAFVVGARPPVEAGFRVVGAHTDSPGLRLKPRPGLAGAGHLLLDVEIYGSPILATWVDRDLGLAGRVVVEGRGGLETRLVRTANAVARLSTVAIHLNRGVNEDGLKLDKHRHLAPAAGLLGPGEDAGEAALAAIGEAADASPDALRGFDLAFFDTTPSRPVGRAGEYLAAPRLDNLGSCHAGLLALLATTERKTTPDPTALVLLFDHEEVGSGSAEGAAGAFGRDLLGRLTEAFPGSGGLSRAVSRSMLVSADMAHAVHPNAPEKHDATHLPRINGGPVVKTNANRRYASDAETAAVFRSLCRRADVPCQEFVSRGDMPCGTTIGPLLAAGVGIRAVDVGSPMLSMHSAREMAGSADPAMMVAVLGQFLGAFAPLPW